MKTIAKNADTVIFENTGSADVLQVKNLTIPAPGPGEVRIATKALGLNRADVMYRNGANLEHPIFPARIGYEASGVVDAVGEHVTHVQAGDRVSIIPAFSLNQYAMHVSWCWHLPMPLKR
ncbi:hypothetical protein EOD41_19700 [Mucilaginibacter limnophilus]|uniref:Alcohol dehydrogenase-like N-terminal domain-containing protein n=1 Tax=Mucilaginibacter limnophilus TaxID=1932778 RepID=A0A3S2UJE7_9SPHI|nr:alcohol dehydrogenase catalytic domain-containing protein [Mucilaginibacter limnophilus]RVT97228.1 hypothetical protein EOD41_19700 [Mucilaginibacter limnophilus]